MLVMPLFFNFNLLPVLLVKIAGNPMPVNTSSLQASSPESSLKKNNRQASILFCNCFELDME